MANLERLNNAINELENQSNDLRSLNALIDEISNLRKEISENLGLLQQNNEGFTDISNEIKNRLNEHGEVIDRTLEGNRAFQRELDASIASRLDRYKSDIQVEIRNEGTQIQRAFETALNSNFNQMESKFRESTQKQTKQLNTLRLLNFILIVISIGLAIGLFVLK